VRARDVPAEGAVIPILTTDWRDEDVDAYRNFCAVIKCPQTVPVTVWANESDNRTTAHNANGNASGLFQMMPATAKGLGYDTTTDPTLAAYRALNVSEQLYWAIRFYVPFAGEIFTVARFYISTFLPALLSHADDPGFVLCGARGPYADAYLGNRGFDEEGKGTITPSDLEAAAQRAVGPRTRELLSRINTPSSS
jgi:hypothetical protein